MITTCRLDQRWGGKAFVKAFQSLPKLPNTPQCPLPEGAHHLEGAAARKRKSGPLEASVCLLRVPEGQRHLWGGGHAAVLAS